MIYLFNKKQAKYNIHVIIYQFLRCFILFYFIHSMHWKDHTFYNNIFVADEFIESKDSYTFDDALQNGFNL